jgi:signal-transduction protein with cAMP-binding, CBS, and nucleotidyltransferase domain
MSKFLVLLEPRFYLENGPYIQDQNQEVFEIAFIMKGRVGVGYRIFNEVFLGMSLHHRQIFNDYAMIQEKVSEFIYMPIIETVHCLALRKENFTQLFKMPFFYKKYKNRWCKRYKKTIQ